VAKAYKKVLNNRRKGFDVIEFAVYCRGYETENYDVFRGILSD